MHLRGWGWGAHKRHRSVGDQRDPVPGCPFCAIAEGAESERVLFKVGCRGLLMWAACFLSSGLRACGCQSMYLSGWVQSPSWAQLVVAVFVCSERATVLRPLLEPCVATVSVCDTWDVRIVKLMSMTGFVCVPRAENERLVVFYDLTQILCTASVCNISADGMGMTSKTDSIGEPCA